MARKKWKEVKKFVSKAKFKKTSQAINKSKIKLDRKVLADLAYNNPEAFKSLVKKVQLSIK